MSDTVARHYEIYPYPHYPLIASVRRCDTYALNLDALWARFNGRLPPATVRRILIAGCGSFSPYPFAVANPAVPITALDLSRSSLRRARLHCLLHGKTNVTCQAGNLLDPRIAQGYFALIDAYGVLHHLDDPAAGLNALAQRLTKGGILRLMVYSRYARKQEESIRRAFKLLNVTDPSAVRRLIKRSKPDSRLRHFAETSSEAGFDAGLADSLLHPRVTTYRIDELMGMVSQSGLQPLLFAHRGALEDVDQEVRRIRQMEALHTSPGNFVLYLGKQASGPCRDSDCQLMLNPCLTACVRPWQIAPLSIAPRLGHDLPSLGFRDKKILRRFIHPIPLNSLSVDQQHAVAVYIQGLFLLQYRV